MYFFHDFISSNPLKDCLTSGCGAKVSIPPLTKDKRVQYVKLAKDYCEKTKAPHCNFQDSILQQLG